MRTRLVVGSSSLARETITALSRQPQPLLVCTDDQEFIDALKESNVQATLKPGDPTEPTTLASFEESVESVLALDDDTAVTIPALRSAMEVFPEAFRLGYVGANPTQRDRTAVRQLADRVVDPATATKSAIEERLSEPGGRIRTLQRIIDGFDGPLAIVMHDNPDPDAIASAVALQRLAEAADCGADPCYYGSITHQENRAFVNLLELDLVNLDDEADLSEYGGFALVDHSRPGVNDQLPEDTPVDIVVDHHPPRGPVEAEFVDLRSQVGATSTLLVEYLQQSAVGFDETIATALLFGIRVDTNEFRREVCPTDFEAAAALVATADLATLQRVDSPSMAPETLETIAASINNRSRHGPAIISGVGELRNRDALAQAADKLLTIEGVTTTLVYGFMDGTIFISARSRGSDLDLGEALRDAFGQIGSAGGHADMAGAQIGLGLLAEETEDTSLIDIVDEVVTERFLDVLEARWNRPISGVASEEYHVDREAPTEDVVVFPPEGDT